jgi:tetratricopeptide (TPR) repeat protein
MLGWASLTSPAFSDEDTTNACLQSPSALCLTEIAEDTLDNSKSFLSQDGLRLRIAKSYMREGDMAAAEANIRKMQTAEDRIPASIIIATRYELNQQTSASKRLFDDIYRQLADPKTLTCQPRMALLYSAVLHQLSVQPGNPIAASIPMPSLLRDATLLAQLNTALNHEKYEFAESLLQNIQDPALRDEALFQTIESRIKRDAYQKLRPFFQQVSRDDARKNFEQLRLPSAYLKHGDYEEAIARAHAIDDLHRKTLAFDAIIATLTEIHNEAQARRLLQFNQDFTKLLDGKEKFEGLLRLAERYQNLGHPTVARNILSKAIQMAKDQPLDYRLPALNDIMQTQHRLEDTKGLRSTALNALNDGLFKDVDALPELMGSPLQEELERYFTLLDGHIAPYDRMLFIREIAQLNQGDLRWRLLNLLKKVSFGDRIHTHKPAMPVEVLEDIIAKHLYTMERSIMRSLIAGMTLALGDKDKAGKQFARIRSYLRLEQSKSHLPVKIFNARKSVAWRTLSLEALRTGDPRQSLKDYANATGEDPDKDFWLRQLMHYRGAKHVLNFTNHHDAVAIATTPKSFKEILNYVEINRSEERRDNLIKMLKATHATGNRENVWQVLEVIEKYDREFSFFVWERILRPSEQTLIPAFVAGYIAEEKFKSAAQWAIELENPTERAGQLILIASELPSTHELKPMPKIYPSPEGVGQKLCKNTY